MRRGIVLAFGAALLLGHASVAHADTEARQHFDEGKKRRDAGDCAGAVPEFDRSLAAEKSIGAYYNLAYCHEQLGRRREAYDAYKHAQEMASAKKDDRYREISGALAALLETPHIRLVLPQPLPEGFQISVDDESIPSSLYANETIVFTNAKKSHLVVATAPGYEERRYNIESKQLRAIALHPARPDPTPAARANETPNGLGTGEWVGIGIGSAGVVVSAILLGVMLNYASERSEIDDELAASPCAGGVDHRCSTADGESLAAQQQVDGIVRRNNELEDDIRTTAPVLGAIAGGLLVVGAGVFVYSRMAKARPTPTGWYVVPHFDPRSASGSVGLGGTF